MDLPTTPIEIRLRALTHLDAKLGLSKAERLTALRSHRLEGGEHVFRVLRADSIFDEWRVDLVVGSVRPPRTIENTSRGPCCCATRPWACRRRGHGRNV